MTLEQIRAALPTHIPLTPGVHRWGEGDEMLVMWYDDASQEITTEWKQAQEILHNKILRSSIACRPIPPHILDNQAFWVWHDQYKNNWPLNEVSFEDFRKHITAGRLYDKWLLEQMEEV